MFVIVPRIRDIKKYVDALDGLFKEGNKKEKALDFVVAMADRLHSKASSTITACSIMTAVYLGVVGNRDVYEHCNSVLIMTAIILIIFPLIMMTAMILPFKWWDAQIYNDIETLTRKRLRILIIRSWIFNISVWSIVLSILFGIASFYKVLSLIVI